jgi:hypothetical protein
VFSFYSNLPDRQVIRETWGKGHDNVYFVVAKPCPIPEDYREEYFCRTDPEKPGVIPESVLREYDADCERIEALVDAEQDRHHDLIRITDVTEAYRHLPHKLKAAYQWAVENTASVFMVKTDDDSFVRVDTLASYLLENYPNGDEKYYGIGDVKFDAKVDFTGLRTSNKNKELPEYKMLLYPPWPSGNSGHAVSRPVAKYVADNRDRLFEYQGEDSSLGIWVRESPFFRKMKWMTSKRFTGSLAWEGRCEESDKFSIGHNISPETMRKCFEMMDEEPGIEEKLRQQEAELNG